MNDHEICTIFSEMFAPHHEALKKIYPEALWWFLPGSNWNIINQQQQKLLSSCSCIKKTKHHRLACRHAIGTLLRQHLDDAIEHNDLCPADQQPVSIPIQYGKNTCGFICICHADKKTLGQLAKLTREIARGIITNIRMQTEISELKETIKPQAIALSTIHTVHRLTSMSLGVKDLLSRITRLCRQVLNVHYCEIGLIEKKGKRWLVPKAWVGTDDVPTPHKCKVGSGQQGAVAKEGCSLLKHSIMAVPLIDEDVIGVLTVKKKKNNKPFTPLDREILITLAEQCVVAMKNVHLYEELEDLTLGTIKSINALLNTREMVECGHMPHFVDVVIAIAEEMRLPHHRIRNLQYAALLPDAGKLSIPEAILSKRGALTGRELKIIQKHPEKGAKVIAPLRALEPVIPIILHHHEKYDGTGYPQGLKGENIPLEARILAVIDSFEAMLQDKPYRKTIAVSKALKEIKANSGTQFDPQVVKIFLKVVKQGKADTFLKEIPKTSKNTKNK